MVWNSAWSSIVSSRIMVACIKAKCWAPAYPLSHPSRSPLASSLFFSNINMIRLDCISDVFFCRCLTYVFSTFCFFNIIWSWSTAVRSGAEKRRPSGRAAWTARPDGSCVAALTRANFDHLQNRYLWTDCNYTRHTWLYLLYESPFQILQKSVHEEDPGQGRQRHTRWRRLHIRNPWGTKYGCQGDSFSPIKYV